MFPFFGRTEYHIWYRKLLANSIVSPYGCCVPYVRKNVFLAMMGVFCAVSGVSICELAIFLVRKTRASVTVPHMGLFYVALCLLHVVNRVAPKNSPFARYRIWSGPVCDIPHMEWPQIRHTAYGVECRMHNQPYAATYRIWLTVRMVHIALLANVGE